MTQVRLTFDLDDLKQRLDHAVELADAREQENVLISRSTWVRARSLCDQYERTAGETE